MFRISEKRTWPCRVFGVFGVFAEPVNAMRTTETLMISPRSMLDTGRDYKRLEA